ncbi:hypothetical protein [Marinobacter sp. CA1]|uniref:hypothetical protein n=1 Tax=Marinobacter sp. CA1 TaxID=2817656 RepID=UPI001D08870E|nr:hypothetical protein [Marinobacter sp. CA1]UDL06949.1 hypothetical protein J2887_09480 [Marinobacter sp. CA1]
MKMTLLFRMLLCVLVISLTACGGGSGSNSDTDGGSGGDDGTGASDGGDQGDGGSTPVQGSTMITLGGADTSSLGSTAEVSFYAFRENLAGSNLFLSATSSGSAMNFVRLGLGELSASDVDPNAFAADQANAVVFNITDIGVSIRININSVAYLYSATCLSGCTGVDFDTASRTLELDNVVLAPTIGGDSNSQATSDLTLDGTIVWTEADEDPTAPAFDSDLGGAPDRTSDLTLADITGVWDSGAGNDEVYTVFKGDGTYVSYDYMGDAVDMGSNCYEIESDTLTDLGNGQFRLGDSRFGTFYFSGDALAFEAPEGTYFLERTTLLESDFSPLCN